MHLPKLALLAALALAAAAAHAHGPDLGNAEGSLEPRLDALPPELSELRVQIRRSIEPQIVLENPGGQMLEVLDSRGVAFLRIGPGGVQGNLAAPSWYHGLSPEGGVVPVELARLLRKGEKVPDRWVRVSAEPSWGWFDGRIEPDEDPAKPEGGQEHGGAKPEGGQEHGGARPEGGQEHGGAKPEGGQELGGAKPAGGDAAAQWSVPVRIGTTASALRGRFVFQPAPRGALRARMQSEAELAPGVRLSLVPGRGGSLFLQSRSPEPVTVIGRAGEPFLRFSPAGVEANLRSVTFAEAARLGGGAGESLALEAGEEDTPHWQRLSPVPSYAWVDPRFGYEAGAPDPGEAGPAERRVVAEWRIPLRIGSGEEAALVHVEGETRWEPFAPGKSKQH